MCDRELALLAFGNLQIVFRATIRISASSDDEAYNASKLQRLKRRAPCLHHVGEGALSAAEKP